MDELRRLIESLPAAVEDAWDGDDGEELVEVLVPALSLMTDALEGLVAERGRKIAALTQASGAGDLSQALRNLPPPGTVETEELVRMLLPILASVISKLEALETRRKAPGCDGGGAGGARVCTAKEKEGWLAGRIAIRITAAQFDADDDGLVFEGNVWHFRECFFDNAELDNVLNWADKENFAVKLLDEEEGQ